MSENDKDLLAFLGLMPPDMRKRMIASIEAVYGATIESHKENQIREAETLITDIQQNPDKYTTAKLKAMFPEIVGEYDISDDLAFRIEDAKHFIGYRTRTIYNTNGTVEEHRQATYEDYLQSDNCKSFPEFYASRKNPRKRKGGASDN